MIPKTVARAAAAAWLLSASAFVGIAACGHSNTAAPIADAGPDTAAPPPSEIPPTPVASADAGPMLSGPPSNPGRVDCAGAPSGSCPSDGVCCLVASASGDGGLGGLTGAISGLGGLGGLGLGSIVGDAGVPGASSLPSIGTLEGLAAALEQIAGQGGYAATTCTPVGQCHGGGIVAPDAVYQQCDERGDCGDGEVCCANGSFSICAAAASCTAGKHLCKANTDCLGDGDPCVEQSCGGGIRARTCGGGCP